MKKLFIVIMAIANLPFMSCQNPNRNSSNGGEGDSVLVEAEGGNTAIVDAFFKEFQEKNDGWTKTEKGHQKLVKAFEEKMTTDIEFAKACASYMTDSEYSLDFPVRTSETISAYSKEDGEEGEIKAFDMVIEVALIKPLYNGQKTIKVKYEIISTIPSTVEEHWRPYIDNANHCTTFDSFLKNEYDATLNLGCFMVANKQDK